MRNNMEKVLERDANLQNLEDKSGASLMYSQQLALIRTRAHASLPRLHSHRFSDCNLTPVTSRFMFLALAESLADGSKRFQTSSRKLKNTMWWQDKKWCVLLLSLTLSLTHSLTHAHLCP